MEYSINMKMECVTGRFAERILKYRCQQRMESGVLLWILSMEWEEKGRELAAKRGTAEARVPESSAGSWGLFPLNALNCENSFVSRKERGREEEQTVLTRSTEMINDKRRLGWIHRDRDRDG